MITFDLGASNDLYVANGNIATVIQINETVQDVRTKLKLLLGEVFYNTLLGVPYFTVIFAKPFQKDVTDSIIIETIYSSPGILNILSYSSRIDTVERKFFIQFEANTTFSQTITLNESFTI